MSQAPLDLKALMTPAAQGGSSWGAVQGRPVAISFGGGLPDPASLPIADLAAAADRVLRRDGAAALQYGGLYGFEGLRDLLAAKVRADDGREVQREQIVLTSGSAHAISLACFAFVNPGDTVLIEAPSFAGSIRAIRSYGARLVSVPVDAHGLVADALESTLRDLKAKGVRPKLLYTIPNFHNPAGVTLTMERRRRVVALAADAGTLVLEDDAYGDLRYDGEPIPSLLSLDQYGAVIKLGSFSKILAPGLRMGWAVGQQEAVAAMVSVRHDMGVSPFLARTIGEYVGAGKLGPHIQGLVSLYRRKRDLMLALLGEHCGGRLRWTVPEGGFFTWVELAEGIDPDRLLNAAGDEGISYVPGPAFFADAGGRRHLRLAFSYASEPQIEQGIAALGRALEKAR